MVNDGATLGLQLWLIFLICFFFMGYSAVFSIVMGAIAGLAGGFISAYVKSKAQAPPPPPSDDDNESPLKRAQNRFRRWHRDDESDQKPDGAGQGWFKRNRRRSLKSSRR